MPLNSYALRMPKNWKILSKVVFFPRVIFEYFLAVLEYLSLETLELLVLIMSTGFCWAKVNMHKIEANTCNIMDLL